jgi:hypothetical protein
MKPRNPNRWSAWRRITRDHDGKHDASCPECSGAAQGYKWMRRRKTVGPEEWVFQYCRKPV